MSNAYMTYMSGIMNVFHLLSALTHAIAHIRLEAKAKGHHRISNAEEICKVISRVWIKIFDYNMDIFLVRKVNSL